MYISRQFLIVLFLCFHIFDYLCSAMITVLGPTASGKTALAVRIAREVDGEILSADSRQVYRRMDIGTGKDLAEYGDVPYHLIDIAEPGTRYDLYQYVRDFRAAYAGIVARGHTPVLCGGTGLYLEAVLRGYDIAPVPQDAALRKELEGRSLAELTEILRRLKAQNGTTMHNTTDVDSPRRAIRAIEIETHISTLPAADIPAPISGPVFGTSVDRDTRRRRITERLHARLDAGMVDEVRHLLAEGIPPENLTYYGLEYKYLTLYATGQMEYHDMVRQLEIAIHQFAKRQMTWFRGMERRGTNITWLTLNHNI